VCSEPEGEGFRGSILTNPEWDELFGGRYPFDAHAEAGEDVPREVQQFRWLSRFGAQTKAQLIEAIEAYVKTL
jgi:hypothetical protein